MFYEPRHLLSGYRARRDDQVSLVLPALIVHYNQKLPAPERRERILDRVEGEFCARELITFLWSCRRSRRRNEREVGGRGVHFENGGRVRDG